MEYHLVWIVQYRRKVFVSDVKEHAEKVLAHFRELDPDTEVIKLNVQMHYLHMAVTIAPKYAVPRVVQDKVAVGKGA